MKYFGLVLCAIAVTCRGAPINNDDQQTISADAAFANSLVKYNGLWNTILTPEQCTDNKIAVTFKLYTRETPNGQKIDPMNNETLKNSSYNIKHNTVIVLDEWSPLDNGSYGEDFASAYLRNKKQRVNVIVVEYGAIGYCDYERFLSMEPLIGQQVGQLLRFLMRYGSIPSKLQLIGVGMGAQISGYAAKEIHPRKVGRLTALNPTFIGYTEKNPQLHTKDSDYMDVMHTAQRKHGDVNKLGNARFYPNGGSRQPIGDSKQDERSASLNSHYASVLYYLASILDPTVFKALKCQDWLHFVNKQCGETVYNYMGDEVDIKLSGNYYLEIASVTPLNENNIKYNDFRRYMDVIVRGPRKIEAAEAATVQQAYEKNRTQGQINSEEDIANWAKKFGPK